jgi:hypothetical protein
MMRRGSLLTRLRGWLAARFKFQDAARRSAQTALIDFRAAALNKNSKHGNKQNAGYNSDDRYAVHTDPPFLMR